MKNIYQILMALLLLSSKAIAQTPAYNSYPSATAVMFLDFDGHYMNATSWNTSGPIDLNSSNLSSSQITEIFNRVAEDFRPFNINITTDSAKYWAAPATSRMRVVLTTSWEWYGSAGGVAYIGSFKWGDNTPCFVFTSLLGYNVKNISEAASHEAGHTLGLRHQSSYDATCAKTAEYNAGNGSGEIGWAPIMGVGYYRNFTVWHNGPNPYGCNSTQDDLSIITGSTNGFGYRTDDHNAMTGTATLATFSNNQFNVSGVIEKTDDRDMFKVVLANRGRLELTAVPYNVGTGNVGSNLDLQVQLMTSNQNVIATYNPGTLLHSIADTVLDAGTYYLMLDGKGNQYASEYGSIGSYAIQGTFTQLAPLPLRKLELKGTTENGKHKLEWIIDADEAVTKQVLEVSNNGRDFSPLGNVNTASRSQHYSPVLSGWLQYRLHVHFDDGKQYYSNTIQLRNSARVKPLIMGNVVSGSLAIFSPSSFHYTIHDASGRLVSRGQLRTGNNELELNNVNSGIYLIRFVNHQEQIIERFVKQ